MFKNITVHDSWVPVCCGRIGKNCLVLRVSLWKVAVPLRGSVLLEVMGPLAVLFQEELRCFIWDSGCFLM